MKAISSSLGNGEIKKVTLNNVINEDWAELMSLDLNIGVSEELGSLPDWHCPDGITFETMPRLNQEFNYFRGLFPLKVFFGGPPMVGKSHYAGKMASAYGIPHIKMADLIHEAQALNDDFGAELRDSIDRLKDVELEKYNAQKKKKDPDLTREDMKPRLSDELLHKIVKNKIGSPACMNKGFIMDGYPRNTEDAKAVFLTADPECVEAEEGAEAKSNKDSDAMFPGFITNDKIMPQFVIMLESEDATLIARDKEMSHDNRNANQTGTRVAERLKHYRSTNGTAADD
jgi:adenylate kinase family enzyme